MSMPVREADFDSLLTYLKRHRSFDFTAYRRTSLVRRIEKRMTKLGMHSFADYTDFLSLHPDEFAQLFRTVLINVTAFFRDSASWDFLAAKIIPELVSRRGKNPIRIWSAGCASGEEPYSLAMLFAEEIGAEKAATRVRIHATDVDTEALDKGRLATYTAKQVVGVPAPFLRKYFDSAESRYVLRREIRKLVVFGTRNLISDPPIPHVDLLVCRNTLMYLVPETQTRIIARFHEALNEDGVLFLGRAETLLSHTHPFRTVDTKRRIARKVASRNAVLGRRPSNAA